ncbi:alpha/beta fold hydrolase [Streptomyces sp. NPDC053474]|uniref:alpha/beta fold hydrolase n=1 Tax=Streptomyces sp. NPDC053474 TaxID=3365704 RepID=UPI0037D50A61
MSREFTIAAADTHLSGVDTLGHEPPLLFLNGGFSTQRCWNRVLARLGGTYRSVTFDARAHGRSGTSSDYSVRGAIDDVDRVIEATVLDRPILVGWSHGATVALCYATEYPDMVGGLVLVDGAYPVSVLDEAGRERVRRRCRRTGWIARPLALFGRSARMTAPERAEFVIEMDEVNGELQADFAALRCPTVFVAGSGERSGASRLSGARAQDADALRAAVEAVASSDRVTVLAAPNGGHPRFPDKDPGLVVAAIEEVRRRSLPVSSVREGQ